ncbi:hypothetical protein LUX73_51395 [Actinomadura madurae]|nr:hypothetical protein [Actinomadura madurae]MCQ0012228.1 hypothetical protein [Actinomadura madurae]
MDDLLDPVERVGEQLCTGHCPDATLIATGSRTRLGRRAVTTRPPPSRGAAVTVPPWAVAVARTIDRPSPEPRSERTRSLPSRAERLEDRLHLVGGDGRAGVGDDDLGPPVPSPGGDVDLAALVVVPDRVLDEVLHEPLDEHRVTPRGGRAEPPVDGHVAGPGLRGGLLEDVPRHVGQVQRPGVHHDVLGAGEGEQPVDEPLVPPVDDQERLAQPFDVVGRVRAAHRHVDQRPVDRERGAQLVRGVRDEPALPVERPRQPAEHRVEGVGQLLDVVARPLVGDPLGEVVAARHPPRRVGDRVDGAQRPVGEQPAEAEPRRGDQPERDAALGEQGVERLPLVVLAALDQDPLDLRGGDHDGVVGRRGGRARGPHGLEGAVQRLGVAGPAADCSGRAGRSGPEGRCRHRRRGRCRAASAASGWSAAACR